MKLNKLPTADLITLYWDKFKWSSRLDDFFYLVPEKYTRKFIISQLKTFCDEYKD